MKNPIGSQTNRATGRGSVRLVHT